MIADFFVYLCKVDIRSVSKKLSKLDISAQILEWWSLYKISCFEWTLKERIIYFSVEIDFSGSEFF